MYACNLANSQKKEFIVLNSTLVTEFEKKNKTTMRKENTRSHQINILPQKTKKGHNLQAY